MSDAPHSALTRRLRHLATRLSDATAPALPTALGTRLGALLDEAEQALDASAAPAAPADAPATGNGGGAAFGVEAPIQVWCDGSCAPNPGPGGWGAIIEQNGRREEISGAAPQSTNNIMEMTAAIEALRRTPEGARVHVTTDSRYLMDGITKWMAGWKRKGWLTAERKPVKNQELWRALDALASRRTVRWEWVEGHSGHPENERCDELANAARRRQ